MDIFIGNIPYDAPAEELAALFARYGHVHRVHLPVDEDGRPRGFGFATMPVPTQATAAIKALDGHSLRGRPLRVNRAGRRNDQRAPETRSRGSTAGAETLNGRSDKRLPDQANGRQGLRRTASMTVALLVPLLFLVVLVESARMGRVSPWICAAYAVMALVTFLTYAADKAAARQGGWRVPEANLHLLAMAGGWPGALAARHLLRHKTVKQPFRVVFALTVAVNCAGFGWLFTDDGASAQLELDRAASSFASAFWRLVAG